MARPDGRKYEHRARATSDEILTERHSHSPGNRKKLSTLPNETDQPRLIITKKTRCHRQHTSLTSRLTIPPSKPPQFHYTQFPNCTVPDPNDSAKPLSQISLSPPNPLRSPMTSHTAPIFDRLKLKQYDYVLREAHRRPALPLGAPALVRHLCLWPNPGPQAGPLSRGATFNWRRWNWYYEIDDFLKQTASMIQSKLDTQVFATNKAPLKGLNPSILDSTEYAQFKKQFSYSLSGPIVPEHAPKSPKNVTIAYWWRGALVKLRLTMHNEYVNITHSIDLSKPPPTDRHLSGNPISKYFEDLHAALDASNRADLKSATEKLYETIWVDFDEAFVPADCTFLKPKTSESPETNYTTSSAFGLNIGSEVLGDFRAVVTAVGSEGPPMRAPSSYVGIEMNTFDFSKEHEYVLNRYRPFVEESLGGTSEATDLSYTVCTMLDGRAIYASSLGSEPPYRPRADGETIKYLLAINDRDQQNRWQIGRLVHRINSLDTLRIAALRDLAAIRETNPTVMQLGAELDDLYERQLGKHENVLNDLNGVFKRLAATGRAIPYGITHRINRSRYAVSTFQRMLQDLRIGRVAGFQPYDEFVRRRLASVFESVDRVGMRLDSLRGRANTLLNIIDTGKLVEFQGAAEVLIFFGGTYYLIGIFEHAHIDKLFDDSFGPAGGLVEGVIAFCIIYIMYRILKAKHRNRIASPLRRFRRAKGEAGG
jgi:Protein of unknown function (DUF3422)